MNQESVAQGYTPAMFKLKDFGAAKCFYNDKRVSRLVVARDFSISNI